MGLYVDDYRPWPDWVVASFDDLDRVSHLQVGTYRGHADRDPGHDMTGNLAVDLWLYNNTDAEHNKVLAWFIKNHKRYGMTYIITNERIFSDERSAEGVRRYTGSDPHQDHIHISYGTTPPKAEPEPIPPESALGVPIMADAESIDLPAYNGNQALSTNGGRVWINADKHTTVVAGSAKGVDVIASVAVEGLKAGEYVNVWWRIEEKHATKPDRTVRGKIHVPITPSSTHPQPSAQISYKGSLPKADTGWTSCLRLMYSTNSKTAKIARVDFDGWKI